MPTDVDRAALFDDAGYHVIPDIDDRATTAEVFMPLHTEFRFTLDVAASAENAKCPKFFTAEDNGLTQPWTNERVWCNPPYSHIEPWLIKAWDEWEWTARPSAPGPKLIVMLLPADRTEQPWWQNQVEPYRDNGISGLRTRFLPGRLRFLKPGQTAIGPGERPLFGSVLLVWS